VATSVKELRLVDTEGDRGLAEAPVSGGAARGLGLAAAAQGDHGLAEAPVAGGGTMGTRAGGGATHTYRDSKKVSLHILGYYTSFPLNIVYEQKPFVTLKKITYEAMDGNYSL
jgi:hypothetical protein